MIDIEQVNKWISSSIKEIDNVDVLDVHIDEFYQGEISNKSKLIEISCQIFDQMCSSIYPSNISSIELFLIIELLPRSKYLKGTPSSKEEIIKDIDMFSMPEIYLQKIKPDNSVSENEFYRSPLLFNLYSNFNNDVKLFYKEYRYKYQIIKNEKFSREVNLVYFK